MTACSLTANAAVLKEARVHSLSPLNREVVFTYRLPEHTNELSLAKVLVLVPGFNGSGRAWLEGDNDWTRFADREGLLLVGPSFQTTMEEVHAHKGYYYPALWSGKATLEAVEEIGRREHVPTERFMLFGFSAGAHFAHGFALWKPERVLAFVAYSAAWWEKPTAAARTVPGLILCGESDVRLEPSRTFFQDALQLKLPWMWRSYSGLGHEVQPQVVRMAQSFLGYHARTSPVQGNTTTGTPKPACYGDIQRYEFFAADSEGAKRIPDELRIPIPSREVAEVWKEEKPR